MNLRDSSVLGVVLRREPLEWRAFRRVRFSARGFRGFRATACAKAHPTETLMRTQSLLFLSLLALCISGCTFGPNPAPAPGPMEVGHYPAPPVGVPRPRVALAPFHVTT